MPHSDNRRPSRPHHY